MSLKKSRLSIMGLAAILILLYHIYPVSNISMFYNIEKYIIKNSQLGVDMFFFCSAYMYKFSDKTNYKKFIIKKVIKIYPIFAISTFIYFIMGSIGIKQTLMTIIGIDFFLNGGGSFLWFIPAILILYSLLLIYEKLSTKYDKRKVLFVIIFIFLLFIILSYKYSVNKSINIFLFRFPIIILGCLLSNYEGRFIYRKKGIYSILLLIIGSIVNYIYFFKIKYNYIFVESFYILSLPLLLGCILFLDFIQGSINLKKLRVFGKISLELYCVQMIIGFMLFEKLINFTQNRIISFLCDFIIIFIISWLYEKIIRLISIKLSTILAIYYK
ncbi:acyltransferase family protein [Helcococcus kunzii]|uniref:acyltransferase family protein n=2 Tax=Helcococcus kunzii TaxID=40091 RepID=UPI0038AF1183